jgi:hypothetical protein
VELSGVGTLKPPADPHSTTDAAGAVATAARSGGSIKKFVRTAHRYRTIEIRARAHDLTAADPHPTTYAGRSNRSTTDETPIRIDRRQQREQIIGLIFGNEESLVTELDESAAQRIADALANIPPRPSDDPQ